MSQTVSKYEQPRWLRDLLRFLPLKSQFVLSGNVRDLQLLEVSPGMVTTQPLDQVLAASLRQAGYGGVLAYDPVAGVAPIQAFGEAPDKSPALLERLGLPRDQRPTPGLENLSPLIDRLLALQGEPIALLVDFASRLTIRPADLSPGEHQFFTRALVAAHRARNRPAGDARKPFYNTIIWVVEREGDLPDWLLVDNPRIRHIPVSKPDQSIRRSIAPALLKPLAKPSDDLPKASADTFVEGTEGMLLLDMNAIALLAKVEGVPLERIGDAVRRYKVGVTEDPWQRMDRERIRNAESFVHKRVKGQTSAVVHMLDIVKRAMTGVGNSRRGNRPRGIAFLAGPTGVGKTELAKTITTLLFGDEGAYIRFDMSEFSAEHADQRLIGAPPGYVGYDAGGELTNAIREKPFSVVLFDEIEKAHPRILDKFLQVLDDGVLTSGRGDRVYFSEALIVFTSNLGIYRVDDRGDRVQNVSADEPYEAVRGKVLAEIQRHFKLVLNRPEILNRIGENIIVFDFIRPEIAEQIFDQMVTAIIEDLASQELTVTLEPDALDSLRRYCLSDLANGGRGIRNQMEARLLNPLARSLFDQSAKGGDRFRVTALENDRITLVAS